MSSLAYIDDTKIWTYDDVQKLDDGNRYEVIDGKLYMLASPNNMHQTLSFEISKQIAIYLEGKTCKGYSAPMDVDFEKKVGKSNNTVQPDIFIVCDENKRKGKNQILGAPDFIIEILSPGDEGKDRNEKLNLYLKNKVREYWIIDPRWNSIEQYVLEKENYTIEIHRITDKVKASIFDDLEIDISKIYQENEYLLREESAPYNENRFEMSEKLKDYLYRNFSDEFVIEEYEAQILEMILNLREDWDYEGVVKLGEFRNCFEMIDGELLYHVRR